MVFGILGLGFRVYRLGLGLGLRLVLGLCFLYIFRFRFKDLSFNINSLVFNVWILEFWARGLGSMIRLGVRSMLRLGLGFGLVFRLYGSRFSISCFKFMF